jgi:hypothetical protein
MTRCRQWEKEMIELTNDEIDLLQWLGKEDMSQYGECHGKNLDSLIAKGLAELCSQETERVNPFIAKGEGIMYRGVRLTDKGIEYFNATKKSV